MEDSLVIQYRYKKRKSISLGFACFENFYMNQGKQRQVWEIVEIKIALMEAWFLYKISIVYTCSSKCSTATYLVCYVFLALKFNFSWDVMMRNFLSCNFSDYLGKKNFPTPFPAIKWVSTNGGTL